MTDYAGKDYGGKKRHGESFMHQSRDDADNQGAYVNPMIDPCRLKLPGDIYGGDDKQHAYKVVHCVCDKHKRTHVIPWKEYDTHDPDNQ